MLNVESCALSLDELEAEPITPVMAEVIAFPKPTLDEVLKYAEPNVKKAIARYAMDLPAEQKEEIEQNAYLRMVEAYAGLDATAGWRSYVFNHCRGAVLDYVKFGKGFHETRWSVAKDEEEGSRNAHKIRSRLSLRSHDGQDIDLGDILGENGVFSELEFDRVEIKWDLVARMASQDPHLLAFAKYVRGQQVDEIGEALGLCRSRIAQLIEQFVARFDDPDLAGDPWVCQLIYALGLASRLGLEDVDQSKVWGFPLGTNLVPVNLDMDSPHWSAEREVRQMELDFGG